MLNITKMLEVIIKTAPTWKPLVVDMSAQLSMNAVDACSVIFGNRRNIKVSKVITQAGDEDDTLYLFSEDQGLVSRTRDLVWDNTPDKDQEYIRKKFYGTTEEECSCKEHKKKKSKKNDTISVGGTIRS